MSKNQIAIMADRLSIEPAELQSVVMQTIMPSDKKVTNEQFISFLSVANEYQLNPMIKEIYAFPAKGGGIQPIVSIDGWLKIINSNPQFDGMEFRDKLDESGNLLSITCKIHRKDREHPVEVTEYLKECTRNTDPWKKYPVRMLRHKATIQAARYAFSLSGIVDPDEAERIQEATQEKDITDRAAVVEELAGYPQDKFDENFPKWEQMIRSGKTDAATIIAKVESKGPLSDTNKTKLKNVTTEG